MEKAVRKYWVETMTGIARPVLEALALDSLVDKMPIECKPHWKDRAQYTYLEALGRTLTGLAPWLDCKTIDPEEEKLRVEFACLARRGIHHGVTPGCRDYMNFSEGYQPIVDAAFSGACNSARAECAVERSGRGGSAQFDCTDEAYPHAQAPCEQLAAVQCYD